MSEENPPQEAGKLDVHTDEQNGVWIVWPSYAPQHKVFGSTKELAIDALRSCIHSDVEIALCRVTSVVEAMTHRASEIELKFQLFEEMLPAVEFAMQLQADSVFVTAPLLEHLAECYAGKLDPDGVERVAKLMVTFGRAHSTVDWFADRWRTNLVCAARIVEEVLAKPGITQFSLRERLQIEKADAARALKYLEAFGAVHRTPTMQTNRVYPGKGTSN